MLRGRWVCGKRQQNLTAFDKAPLPGKMSKFVAAMLEVMDLDLIEADCCQGADTSGNVVSQKLLKYRELVNPVSGSCMAMYSACYSASLRGVML